MASGRKCAAFHAGDKGVGRDTTIGEMRPRRNTGHFGTGTYFVGSRDKLGTLAKGRKVHCLGVARAKLLRPETTEDAQRLFDALRGANEAVATRTELSTDEFKALRKALPQLSSSRISSVLDRADGNYADCRSGAAEFCDLDSASTMLVRAAGYDGVDVRGLERFDNTMHGSVLYRKQRRG
jgi:hypothetical protein